MGEPLVKLRWIDHIDYLIPSENPLLWILINLGVAVYSLLLLEMDYFAEASSGFQVLAEGHYIVYNFLTTALWVTQVGLVIVYDGWDASSIEMKVMVVLGFLFLLDSTNTLLRWNIADESVRWDSVWTVVNLAAYAWETYELVGLLQARVEFKKQHESELQANPRLRLRSFRYSHVVETTEDKNNVVDVNARRSSFLVTTVEEKRTRFYQDGSHQVTESSPLLEQYEI